MKILKRINNNKISKITWKKVRKQEVLADQLTVALHNKTVDLKTRH